MSTITQQEKDALIALQNQIGGHIYAEKNSYSVENITLFTKITDIEANVLNLKVSIHIEHDGSKRFSYSDGELTLEEMSLETAINFFMDVYEEKAAHLNQAYVTTERMFTGQSLPAVEA